MKAVIINRYGGPEVLEYVDVVTPKPKKNEILIKIKAASVNPVDWKVRKGKLKFITGKKFPLYLGVEASGIVEAVGEEVTSFKPGQKVFAGKNHTGGAYADYFTVSEKNAVLLPDNFPFDEGATLAVTGVTSLQALRDHAGIEEGMKVLVNGASGGIGIYAVQIAKILGAHVTAVCSGKNKKLVKSIGADAVINYTKENFSKGSEKYDIILDAVGNKPFSKVANNLTKNGTLIKLNFSLSTYFDQYITTLFSNKNVKMVLLKNKAEDVKWIRDQIALKNIKVIIDCKFPMEEVRKAHNYSETGRAKGKIILENS